MQTECCQCDRTASVYHGAHAYCTKCYRQAVKKDTDAHRCPRCGKRQPTTVLWRADAPCGECQDADRQDTVD